MILNKKYLKKISTADFIEKKSGKFPLAVLCTLVASSLRVWCALNGVRFSGGSPDPRVGPLGGLNVGPWGGGLYCKVGKKL